MRWWWLCRVLWYRVEFEFAPICIGIRFVLCCYVGGGYAVFCGAVGFFFFFSCCGLVVVVVVMAVADGRVVVVGVVDVFLVVKYIIFIVVVILFYCDVYIILLC